MSRSYRKLPFAAHCVGSQKKDKRTCNRRMRRFNRVQLNVCGADALFIRHDEALNKWSMIQDGTRHYVSYLAYLRTRGRFWNPGILEHSETLYLEWYKWVKSK